MLHFNEDTRVKFLATIQFFKKTKKVVTLIFILVITLIYFGRVFGFSPSAKFTYNITTASQYDYVNIAASLKMVYHFKV